MKTKIILNCKYSVRNNDIKIIHLKNQNKIFQEISFKIQNHRMKISQLMKSEKKSEMNLVQFY
jgi:hypothetical protein